ncbi:MAG TPA: hypothetical protein VKN99_22170 [Polyangia bacterium]|nr:hypothetical protein [Polyangia bacterium]
MEDRNKPGKPRDISDLKARLGLAKPAPPVPRGDGAAPGRPGAPRAIPAPPGASAQAQAAPAPDMRTDPLRAMGAMASAAPAPAYHPYIDDGKPVESVAARGAHRAARMTLGFALLGGFIFGYWWGGVVGDRKMHNRMVDDAARIKGEVEVMSKRLTIIVDALNRNGQKYPTGAPDFELTAAMKGFDLSQPNQTTLFRTNYARFEDIAIDELFNYYNDTIALYEQIRRHVSASEKEKDLLDAFAKESKTQDVLYGVVIEPGKVTTGKLVQLIENVCKGGKKDCTNVADLEGFMATYSPGGTTFKAVLSGSGPKVIPLAHSEMFDGMVSGARPEALAGLDYKRRLANIRILATKLFNIQKSLQQHLADEAAKPKVFAL